MRKKLFTLLLAVAASVGTMFAWDYERVQIGDLYYNLDATNHTAEVTYKSYTNYEFNEGWGITTANIPASVTYNEITYSVTSIGMNAFYDCTGLTSVTIPNSVTNIGSVAFGNCSSLTSVTIPNSVTSIGSAAFYVCDVLTSVHISDIAAWCTISFGDYIANPLYYAHNLYVNEELVTDLVIPESVTSIGSRAFSNYSGLTSVTIPNSVTSIGYAAFYNCSGLTSVTIGNSVTSIGDNAFYLCTGLISVTIPNSVTSIGSCAFEKCTGLTSVTIPNSVTSIGNNAFAYCSGLTSVHISDIAAWCAISFGDGSANPLNNGHNLYVNEELVTDLVIPNSVTSIGNYAFYKCSGLTSVTIPNSVTSIGWSAFSNCSSLTSVTIPNSVTSIGNYAFYNCSVLTSFTNYATTPQVINANVFNGVNKSTCMLYVPAESIAAYLAADVWKEFGNILAIDDSTEEVNYATLADIYNMAPDSTFTLGAFDVMYVPDFQSGSNMYIKDSTGSCVIYKVNYGLQAGDHVEAGLQGKVSIYNGLHEVIPITAKEELTITHGEAPAPMVATEVPSLNNASQYVVYEGVSFTTDTAFVEGRRHTVYGSWNGQTITFYNQYYIGATLSANKTYNITAVNTIYRTTPQAYPLVVEEVNPAPCIIASGTCGAEGDNLTWTLSCDSVLTISGTGAMADYSYSEQIPQTPWNSYLSEIKSVVIEEGATNIGIWAFYECTGLTSVTIPNSVTSIGNKAFCNCSGLTSVTIPNSVTSIGSCAFENCTGLTSVTIPNSVTSIGNYAFMGCSGLTSVTIPNSVTSIGWGAFSDCTGLTSPVYNAHVFAYIPTSYSGAYTIPDGIESIAGVAFSGCSGLTSVTIPNSITSIGWGAFRFCSGLTSVTIPNSVTSIGYEAFYYCTGLTSVTNYAETPQPINANVFSNVDLSACTLYVPAESIALYQAADVWKDFGTILPIDGTVEVEVDTITVAQALEIGSTLAANVSTDKQYTIRGYVSAITTPFSEQYLNQTFYIADDSLSTARSNAEGGFYVYRGKPITGQPIKEGALVELTTAIKNYNNRTIENAEQNVLVTVLKEGPECRILSGTCGENLTWTLNTCDSVLTINGTGAMYDYSKQNVAPWTYLGIKSAVIGNGVTTLGTFAFYQCAMSSISIPASVTKVHTSNNSYNLMNFTVDSANPVYSSLDGVLFNKDQTIIVRYPRGRQGEYAIPEGVVIVGDGAFNGCYNVTDVKIPNSVTTLGMAAFFACGMAEITIPENVNRIDSLVFIGCQHLKVVTNYAIEPQVIDTNVFGGVIDISECTLYVPAQSLAAYLTADVWKDFGNIVAIEGDLPVGPTEGEFNVLYVGQDGDSISSEQVMLHLPVAPEIAGFTFLKWQVVAGDLENGIIIQAVYQANEYTSAPEVYTNPANPAQKLIRNGNVYILTDDKIYSITGQTVR